MPNSFSALERDITEQSLSTWTDLSVCEGMGLPRSVVGVLEQKLDSPEWLLLIISIFLICQVTVWQHFKASVYFLEKSTLEMNSPP